MSFAQEIVINEFMASNSDFLFDEDGDDVDWIEIYNNTDRDISLFGYALSDRPGDISKWRFPDTVLVARSFLLVFASGKDRPYSGRELHTNFSISAAGEDLILAYHSSVLQHIEPVTLRTNESYGAYPDGGTQYFVFTDPTPGMPNKGHFYYDEVTFSTSGGMYRHAFDLALSCSNPSYRIMFTLDGSTPTAASIPYSAPLRLSNTLCSDANIADILVSPPDLQFTPILPVPKCIVIKAAVFDEIGVRVSDVETHSYFIADLDIDHGDLPVMSITTDHAGLFDFTIGIMVPGVHWDPDDPDWTGNYYQRGGDWERTCSVEFYEADRHGSFRQTLGLRIHGGFTRKQPQKALRLYARNEYGLNTIDYRFFDDKATRSFRRLVLRPFSNSVYRIGMEDYIANRIAATVNSDYVASRPVVLYLNGEYWGIYYIQERFDEYYLATYHDVDDEDIDIVEGWYAHVVHGDSEDFMDLYQFMHDADMTEHSQYEEASNRIDIENFIDYQLVQIFIANVDWPANNTRMWRNKSEAGKWQWVFFDGDYSLIELRHDGFENALSTADTPWPTNARSTMFLRVLMTNDDFKARFFDRLEYLLNNEFLYERTIEYCNDAVGFLQDEIQRQVDRFRIPRYYSHWMIGQDTLRNFLRFRACELERLANERFGITMSIPPCSPSSVDLRNESLYAIHDTIHIYPNPAYGVASLSFEARRSGAASFRLTNVLGQSIPLFESLVREGSNTVYFNTTDLTPGLYILSVNFNDYSLMTRMLISR